MLVGYVDRCTPSVISGWAADTDAPESVVSVIIYVDNQRLATLVCDKVRPDLQIRSDLQGHLQHGFHCELSPALDFERIEHIAVRFARTGEVLVDGNWTRQRQRGLSPILVTASARSGTTFLMGRLLQSSRICGAALPPFEVRLLAYWSYVYRTLTAGANYDRSTHPNRPEGDGFRVGSNPYSHRDFRSVFPTKNLAEKYFNRFVPDAAADFIRTSIGEYYALLRDDQEKNDAIFFAEKCNNVERTARHVSKVLFPNLKEIIIIRDPRDIFCSRSMFFHEEAELAFAHVSNSCRELLNISRDAGADEIFLKYESLVAEDSDAFKNLSRFLGVHDLATHDSAKESALFQSHATSSSATESVGRWRSLAAEQIERCNRTWGEFLDTFGYER
jgi:hypothetical protein